MLRHIFTTIALLPLLLGASQAAQKWDSSFPFGVSSEDYSSTSSYLGVDIADITTDRLGTLKLKEEKGVEVTMVDQDAPAGKAGIKEHDVILTMNGTVIDSKTQLQRMIHETPAGRVVTFGLSREGQPVTLKVQLGDRRSEYARMAPKDGDWSKSFHVEVPPIPNMPTINMPEFEMPNIGVVVVYSSARSGMMVENLTPQLGEFFGAKSGHGVLVRSVEKGSRADKAGLRAGDVITRVGDQPVHDTSDFTHALHGHSAGSVTVGVIRDKKEQTLTLALPERKESGEIFEESMQAPEQKAETLMAIGEAQNEIAKMQPQMELATEEYRKVSSDLLKSSCVQKKQMKKQAEKLQKELAPKVGEEMEKMQEEMKEFQVMERFDI